jgi:hypothetical protein
LLDFLNLVDAVKPQSGLSRGGLLESLQPHDLYLLVGLWDDEHSLRGLAGSSSVLLCPHHSRFLMTHVSLAPCPWVPTSLQTPVGTPHSELIHQRVQYRKFY